MKYAKSTGEKSEQAEGCKSRYKQMIGLPPLRKERSVSGFQNILPQNPRQRFRGIHFHLHFAVSIGTLEDVRT